MAGNFLFILFRAILTAEKVGNDAEKEEFYFFTVTPTRWTRTQTFFGVYTRNGDLSFA